MPCANYLPPAGWFYTCGSAATTTIPARARASRISVACCKDMLPGMGSLSSKNMWTTAGRARALTVRAFRICFANRFEIVLVKDLSRLGRDYIQTGWYLEQVFPEHGVRLIAVGDGIDTVRPDTDLAPFRNVINEMYARDTSRKIRSALHTKMKAGKFIGNFAPYGYQKAPRDKNHLIPDERAATTVRQIFAWAAAGRARQRSRGC